MPRACFLYAWLVRLPTASRPLSAWSGLLLLVLCLSTSLLGEEAIRLGFSASMFTGINDNDAKAALKVLVETLSKEKNLAVDQNPPIFSGTTLLYKGLADSNMDGAALASDELWVIRQEHPDMEGFLAVAQRDPGEEYLLMVRQDSGIKSLQDLKDKRVVMHFGSRMRVGYFWLELVLARQGLPESAQLFRECTRLTKLSKVVLDVFFKKADCCLVSRRSFNAMIEMNPQVGKQLVPLLASERLGTRMFLYRKAVSKPFEHFLTALLDNINATTSGRQALLIFQVDSIVEVPPDELARSMAVMDECKRLRPDLAERMAAEIRTGAWQPSLAPVGR